MRPNSRVQVTPLARPVNRGVFGARPVPSVVPISKAASGAPDADRWAAQYNLPHFKAVRLHRPLCHITCDSRLPIDRMEK